MEHIPGAIKLYLKENIKGLREGKGTMIIKEKGAG
jgi:hypothetical protein